jgi:hypothetical protein
VSEGGGIRHDLVEGESTHSHPCPIAAEHIVVSLVIIESLPKVLVCLDRAYISIMPQRVAEIEGVGNEVGRDG